jgi:hypothetical protein
MSNFNFIRKRLLAGPISRRGESPAETGTDPGR